jgi:hypothetical protein
MKRIFTIFLSIISLGAFSQQVSPEVIASAGDHFENDDISLSWTLGEPVISTLSGEYILTQGFHQDLYIITAIDEVDITEYNIQIFPNPTADYLTIEFNSLNTKIEEVIIQLFDIKGGLIKEYKKSGDPLSTRINLQSFERANYFLRININGQIKNYKIVKT